MYNNRNEIKEPVHSITLDIVDQLKLKNFIKKALFIKNKEYHHIIDSNQEEKRWFTGIGAELAVEKFLGKKFVDLTVGLSNNYNKADLKKLDLKIGVKCTEYGKYHIIFKDSKEPEIIVFRDNNRFDILGLATVEVLNTYQNSDLILSPNLRARGIKTGFFGYKYLKPFKNLKELKGLIE